MSEHIARSPDELYAYWRNFSNLPKFMSHLKSVEIESDRRSKWTINGLGGVAMHWTADIIADEPGRRIAWRSLAGGDIDTAGTVHFKPAPGGATVRVVLDYVPPAGKVGAAVAKLFGHSASGDVADDLRRFKQIMEAGELPTIDEPAAAAI